MIDEFLAELGRSLHGPTRAKASLLDEAAAGLDDAACAYRRVGVERSAAAARAVADFGTVAAVRAAFQEELDIANARRMASLAVLLLPLLQVFWNVAWELNPYPSWDVPSVPFVVAAASGTLALVAAFAGMAVLVATMRRPSSTGRLARRTRLVARTGTAAFGVVVLVLLATNPYTLLWPPSAVVVAAAVGLAISAALAGREGTHDQENARSL